MFGKASPAPRKPMAPPPGFTASPGVSASLRRAVSSSRKTAKSTVLQSPAAPSSQRSRIDAQLNENDYSLSELILPFRMDAAARLMKQQQQPEKGGGVEGGDCLQKPDLMELQLSVDDYAEGLIYSTRQLFMHDNENMMRHLREMKNVPTPRLFLQIQREMRQLTGDDSPSVERQLIQTLSDLLEA